MDNIYDLYKDNQDYINTVNKYKNLYENEQNIQVDNTKTWNVIKIGDNYTNKPYYKYVSKDMIHNNYKYADGLNVDINEFNPNIQCAKGGLYFCNIKNISYWYSFGTKLYKVFVPKDIPICHEIGYHNKFKAPAIYLADSINIGSNEYYNLLLNTSENNNVHIANNISYNFYTHKTVGKNISDYKDIFHSMNLDTNKKLSIEQKIKTFYIINKYLANYDKEDKQVEESINGLNKYLLNNQKINNESISNIAYSYLYYKDTTFFRYLNDHYYDYLDTVLPKKEQRRELKIDIAINNIKTYLTNLGFNTNKFLDLIKSHEGIISGSFLLAKRETDFDDIDIYLKTNKDKFNPIDKIFKNSKNINDSGLFTDKVKINMRINNKKSTYFDNKNDNYNRVISLGLEINGNKFKLQFILVNEDPFDFINRSFDFNFCKIAFDGETIKSNYFTEVNNYNGYISEDYIKSCLDVDSSMAKYRICKTLERIEKYMKRGYKINNYKEFLNIIIKYMKEDNDV